MLHARRSRGGKGLLPPNPKQWQNEHNGLDLREQLHCPLECALSHKSAFSTLSGVEVLPHGEVPLADVFVAQLRNSRTWSGLSIPFPDGGALVIYNDAHSLARARATLMEEFFHLRLGHPTSTVRLNLEGGRTHDRKIEDEAFGSGAAALLPYKSLREMVMTGRDCDEIAERFEVSTHLVEFRAKVTRLYSKLVR